MPWPSGIPDDVEHAAALGARARRGQDRAGDAWVDQRLGRRLEPATEQDARRAERQRRGDAAAVGDAAGREHGNVTRQVDDEGHEREQRAAAPRTMPAALGALRDDQVRSDVERPVHLVQVDGLDDQRGVRPADRWNERRRIAEREHDRGRLERQRVRDIGDVRAPAEEADAPRPRGPLGRESEFAGQPGPLAATAADQAEPARTGHCCGQGATGRSAHRCLGDRMGDAEQLGEPGRDRHRPIFLRPS